MFEAANSALLLQELSRAWHAPGMLEQLGHGARAAFESHYTEESNYLTMMMIYEKAKRQNESQGLL